MSTEALRTTDPQEAADSQAVLDHLLHKTPIDPEVYRRVQERAGKVTERLRRQFGTMDVAVELIRQTRNQ